MEEIKEIQRRKGIHKYFHVSKSDTYFYAIFSIGLFALVAFKVLNRIFDLGTYIEFIIWQHALQLAILWAILGFVSHAYYIRHEQKYDQ